MLSHVHIGIVDFDRAFSFYAALLPELGLQLKFTEPGNGWAGWVNPGMPRPLFLIGLPYDGGAAAPGNGQMVALLAADRPAVDRVHALAMQLGGVDDGPPRPAPALSSQLLRRLLPRPGQQQAVRLLSRSGGVRAAR